MSYAQTHVDTNIGDMIYASSNTDVVLVNNAGTSIDQFYTITLVPGIYSFKANYNVINDINVEADIIKVDFGLGNNASQELSQQQIGIILGETEGWSFPLNNIFQVQAGYGNPVQFGVEIVFTGATQLTAVLNRVGYNLQIVRIA